MKKDQFNVNNVLMVLVLIIKELNVQFVQKVLIVFQKLQEVVQNVQLDIIIQTKVQ